MMAVKFDNGVVPIYKLRQGTLVRYEDDYFHIQYVYKTLDQQIKLTLTGAFESVDVMPTFVEWLEPM